MIRWGLIALNDTAVKHARETILHAVQRPAMYGVQTFREMNAFLCGVDVALEKQVLLGFYEWLHVTLDPEERWTSCEALIINSVGLKLENGPNFGLDEAADEQCRQLLRRFLEEFFAEAETDQGLTKIRDAYRQWQVEADRRIEDFLDSLDNNATNED